MPLATGIGHRHRRGASRSAGGCARSPVVDFRHPFGPVATEPVTETRLSQMEAARLAGCSRDTIVRARR